MTTRILSTLRSALSLLSIRFVLQQLALALIVFALYALWLHVPDASFLDVMVSALLAILTLAVAGAGESAIILHLCGQPRTPWKLLRGVILLLAGAVAWLAWNAVLSHFRGSYNQNDDRLAGYLNSRFPHALRYIFTYEHLLRWIGWAWELLGWIAAGVIASFIFSWTAGLRPMRAVAMLLRSVTYWCVVVLVTVGPTLLTSSLMHWTPGHGLRDEMVSLVFRLGVALLADSAAVCLLLATLAVFTRRSDVLYMTSAGTPDPDDNQLRTATNP